MEEHKNVTFDNEDENYTYYRCNTNNNEDTERRLAQLEKDKEFLLKKNIELENNINRLETIINSSLNIKPITNVKQNKVVTKTKPIHTKRSISSNRKNRSKSNNRSTSRNKIKINPNEKYQSVKQKQEKENKELKRTVAEMEKMISDLNDEIKLNNLEEKGESYLRYELEIWKQRTDNIGKELISNLNELKKTLFNDKNDYINQIEETKRICNCSLNDIKERSINAINKQNYLIEKYTQENAQIKKKIDKIKSIVH